MNEKVKKDREWRKRIIDRDKVCQICGKSEGRFNAHHLIPRQFEQFRWDDSNGMCLCIHCHAFGKFSVHKNPIWFAQWLRINRPELHVMIIQRLLLLGP